MINKEEFKKCDLIFTVSLLIFICSAIFANSLKQKAQEQFKKELILASSYVESLPLPVWNKDLKGNFIKVNKAYEFYVLDELNRLTGSDWNKNNIIGVNQFEVFGNNKNLDSVYLKDITAYNNVNPLIYDEFITVEGRTYKFPMCIYKTGDSTIGGVALINFEDFK